jgi:putative Mg2+ transporter-C (MgtC) family protein
MDAITIATDTVTIALRLGLAVLLGAAIGLNRELSLKPAGLRTHALVALGAALATHVGLQLTQQSVGDTAAPGRIIQGIVAGVGFIGGGAILHRAEGGNVHGLTTAASIWVVAATGVAAGAGLWRAAVLAVVFSLILLAFGGLDQVIHRVGRNDGGED